MKTRLTINEIAGILGINPRSARRKIEGVPYELEGGKRFFAFSQLPLELQLQLAAQQSIVPFTPVGEFTASPYTHAPSEDLLHDPRVQHLTAIVLEASNPAPGWKLKRWKQAIADKYKMNISTLYDLIGKHETGGPGALQHTKSNRGKPKVWSPNALDFATGLVLKRPHRKMSLKGIYEALLTEAYKKGWETGCYRSFTAWMRNKLNPQLLALRDGGRRGLDNILPPILRSYSDLEPFEIIVGDQHEHMNWVMSDDGDTVFKPESYFTVDARTRLIYGFWLGTKYNRYSIGLALRLGCYLFGGFKSFYSDNGRPELSKYVTGIVNEISLIGGALGEEMDLPLDVSDEDPEETACVVVKNHRRAIPKNAKAKLIESFFHHFEGLLRDRFKIPGHVKRLSATGEEREIDEIEAKKLAKEGKLLKFSEFVRVIIKAIDFYNRERPHRGLLREWAWKPRPAEAIPFQCLMACCQGGWGPIKISNDVLDLAFLPKERRTVDRGRIRFRTAFADLYEHSNLAPLHGQQVSIRFDPLDPSYLLVFSNCEFICRALPVEYSSMKDTELAQRKIEGKARLRKSYLVEYRQLTSQVPDLVQYSTIPKLETAARAVREQIRAESSAKLLPEPSPEQVQAEVRANEAFESRQGDPLHTEVDRPGKTRQLFEFESDRFGFLMGQIEKGVQLSRDDLKFIGTFQSKMDADARDFWKIHVEIHGIKEALASVLRQVS